MKKKTLIIGATPNPDRYAYKAAHKLVQYGHPIVNVGVKKGEVANQPIETPSNIHSDIDTITLYVNPANQQELYQYILDTKPKRIIFNPGTENDQLVQKAREHGIETLEACTLVMLSIDQY